MTSVDPARILVGVPALDEARHIEACIASLMVPAEAMTRVRIVVADGGSTDGTQAVVARLVERFPNLVLMSNPARLQAAAINRVVAAHATADHDILVRADAHAVYPPRYVLDVAECLVARDAAAVATTMDATGAEGFQRAAAWVMDTRLGTGGAAHRGGRVSAWVEHGHHAGFRLDWFRRVGGYDESFSHNEDAELDHRIGLAGGRIWLESRLRLAYSVRPSPGALARQYWNYGAGRARTMRKHRLRPRPRQILPPAMVAVIGLGLVLTPLTPLGYLPLGIYAACLVAVSIAGAFALGRLYGLWAGPALAAMHLSWGAAFLCETLLPREREVHPARPEAPAR